MVIRVEISSKEIADLAMLLQGLPKSNVTVDDIASAFVKSFKESLHHATIDDSALT